MKKLIFYIFLLLILLNLSACTNNNPEEDNQISLDSFYDVKYIPTSFDNVKGFKEIRNNTYISDEYSELQMLENDLNQKFLHSNLTENNDVVYVLTREETMSQLFILPKTYDKDADGMPVIISPNSSPSITVKWISDSAQDPVPNELLGLLEKAEEYSLKGNDILIVKTISNNPFYSAFFKYEDKTYKLDHFSDLDTIKSYINSFFEQI